MVLWSVTKDYFNCHRVSNVCCICLHWWPFWNPWYTCSFWTQTVSVVFGFLLWKLDIRFLVINWFGRFFLLLVLPRFGTYKPCYKRSRPCRTALLRGHCKMKMGWVWCHLDLQGYPNTKGNPKKVCFFVPGNSLWPLQDGEVAFWKGKVTSNYLQLRSMYVIFTYN